MLRTGIPGALPKQSNRANNSLLFLSPSSIPKREKESASISTPPPLTPVLSLHHHRIAVVLRSSSLWRGMGGAGERWRNERRGGRRGAPSEPGPDPRAANKSDHKLFYCALTTLFPPPPSPPFPCVCVHSPRPLPPLFHREFSLGAGFAGANASLRQRL